MSLRLYDYAASANCYKVRLLLAQLELSYERVPVDIFGGDTLSPDFAAKNPSLTTPVLELGPGEYLPESNAILLHLAERAGAQTLPASDHPRAQVYRWLFFEQASIVPMIGGLRFRLLTGRLAPDSEQAQQMKAIGQALVAVADAHLAGREFFVGDGYSVSDVGMFG